MCPYSTYATRAAHTSLRDTGRLASAAKSKPGSLREGARWKAYGVSTPGTTLRSQTSNAGMCATI
eukprot:scaffold112302_cov67-Phaeocystis_antarctica.AAC.5